jgi:hypothetical protein
MQEYEPAYLRPLLEVRQPVPQAGKTHLKPAGASLSRLASNLTHKDIFISLNQKCKQFVKLSKKRHYLRH